VDEGRNDGVAEHDGVVLRTEHLREREAVDVGVENADLVSRLSEGNCQVDGD